MPPQLIDQTGASVTNKGKDLQIVVIQPSDIDVIAGIYYDHGKEPPAEGPPKLHLLVESNEEWRVSVVIKCGIQTRVLITSISG